MSSCILVIIVYLFLLNCSRNYCLRLQFFYNLFCFYYHESNYLYCILYVFRYFCQRWLICLESKDKIMCFRIFFYRVSKFIWGMSLADRPIICKKLQLLVTNIILSIWIFKIQGSEKTSSNLQSNLFGFKIQDSRLRKNFFNPTPWLRKKLLQSNLFGFKIQGSEKTSWIQGDRIQDSRFQKWILDSKGVGFRIQDSRLKEKTSWVQGGRIQDSRFQKGILESTGIGFKIQGSEKTSWIHGFKIQDSKKEFLNPRR